VSRETDAAREERQAERKAAVQVEVVESRLTGSGPWTANGGQWKESLKDRVAGALAETPPVNAGALRLKVVFNARGEVDRVEPVGPSAGLERRVRGALRSFRLQGVTGGWVVVVVVSSRQ
jgi:hypothetical protein